VDPVVRETIRICVRPVVLATLGMEPEPRPPRA
jgi:hypothetical protein